MIPAFRLRFEIGAIPTWAARYDYADDTRVVDIGADAQRRGWFTRAEFLEVAEWKTDRSRSRCRLNSEQAVRDATHLALATRDERLRLGVLTLLQGVGMPTASVLLHLAHRDRYPIIELRALWSLGVDVPPSYYSFEYWMAYTAACRRLASEAGVDMRTLDRALWQYSAEHPATAS